MATSKRRSWQIVAVLLAAAAIGIALILYDRLWREQPQPDWILETKTGEPFGDTQFKYLSIGAERNAGIPYWVFYVLPMMFPEKLPGIGGYGSFGLPWEEGVELPIGLTKRVIGYPRVGINCALCHTTRYRKQPNVKPTFVPTGPGHTANVEALSRFLYECAQDPRFNSNNILAQIGNFTKLDWIDRLLYRFVIIPATKERILKGGEYFLWTYRDEFPAWGRGSDGPMYSSKYVRDEPRPDGRFGSSQFPAVWNLAKYQGKNGRGDSQRLNVTGDGRDAYSVVAESIAGLLGPPPHDSKRIERDAKVLTAYLERAPAPPYPYDRDDRMQPDKVASGKAVFESACAGCHAPDSPLVGRLVPLDEIQTDPDYASKAGAAGHAPGYTVQHLDGIWLRGPYLHNGSVPSIWDLLTPAQQRPKSFYRGYDVLDPKDLGFVSREEIDRTDVKKDRTDVSRRGMLFDTTKQGNGNQGHEYGTNLSVDDKRALIEFLKTL
jgi:hypothetical protein